MHTLILWLSKRRVFTTSVTLAYFVPNVLCHDLVQKVAVTIEKKLSLGVFNAVITTVGLPTLAVFSWFVFVRIRNRPHQRVIAAYWCFNIGLAAFSYNTLMAKNIEVLHFPQYALLTVPVFALTMRFGETVAWVTLLGALDEAYQYLVLHRSWVGVYDFGDVILNLIGAGIGVVFIASLIEVNPAPNPGSTYSLRKLIRSPAFIMTGGLLGCGIFLYLTELLSLYPENSSRALLVLNRRSPPPQYWLKPTPAHKFFHILHPGEAVLLLVLLTAVYIAMDNRVEAKGGEGLVSPRRD